MNEKNEQDIFKDLIDSIHVEDNADLERQEPVQVPIQRSNPPEAANQVQKDAPSDPLKNAPDPQKVPVRRTDSVDEEELPRWLTEKRRPAQDAGLPHPAVSGGARVSNGMSLAPDDRDRTNAAKKAAAAIGERQIPADPTDVSYGEAQDPSSEGFQVNISQQDYERPSASLPEKDEQKRPSQPAPVSGKKKAKKKIIKKTGIIMMKIMTTIMVMIMMIMTNFRKILYLRN